MRFIKILIIIAFICININGFSADKMVSYSIGPSPADRMEFIHIPGGAFTNRYGKIYTVKEFYISRRPLGLPEFWFWLRGWRAFSAGPSSNRSGMASPYPSNPSLLTWPMNGFGEDLIGMQPWALNMLINLLEQWVGHDMAFPTEDQWDYLYLRAANTNLVTTGKVEFVWIEPPVVGFNFDDLLVSDLQKMTVSRESKEKLDRFPEQRHVTLNELLNGSEFQWSLALTDPDRLYGAYAVLNPLSGPKFSLYKATDSEVESICDPDDRIIAKQRYFLTEYFNRPVVGIRSESAPAFKQNGTTNGVERTEVEKSEPITKPPVP